MYHPDYMRWITLVFINRSVRNRSFLNSDTMSSYFYGANKSLLWHTGGVQVVFSPAWNDGDILTKSTFPKKIRPRPGRQVVHKKMATCVTSSINVEGKK